MKKQSNIVIGIISSFFFLLPSAYVTGKNVTLNNDGLMSLDRVRADRATLLERTDLQNSGILLKILFEGINQQEYAPNIDIVSEESRGAGTLTDIDISMYENYQLKFVLISIDQINIRGNTAEAPGPIIVGALIGPYDNYREAFRPEVVDLHPSLQYDTSVISSTPVRLEKTPSIIGLTVYPYQSRWNPSKSEATVTILVQPAPGCDTIPKFVYFADPNLKAAVEEKLMLKNPVPEDIEELFYLDAGGRGIADLTGLKYATNLMELDLSILFTIKFSRYQAA